MGTPSLGQALRVEHGERHRREARDDAKDEAILQIRLVPTVLLVRGVLHLLAEPDPLPRERKAKEWSLWIFRHTITTRRTLEMRPPTSPICKDELTPASARSFVLSQQGRGSSCRR